MTEIRHTFEALVSPFFVALLLMVFAMFFGWKVVCARRLLIVSLVVLVSFSTSFLPKYLTEKLESIYPPILKFDASIKNIVVLSGGSVDVDNQHPEMVLSTASIKRLLTGIRIWRALPKSTLILSGDGYGHQISEAFFLQKLANQCGVPLDDIKLEDQSLNTIDQVEKLKYILGNKPFYLVTSAIHLPRSMAFFRDEDMNPIPVSSDPTYFWYDKRWQKRYIPNAFNLVYTNILLHEYLGLLDRYIRRFVS